MTLLLTSGKNCRDETRDETGGFSGWIAKIPQKQQLTLTLHLACHVHADRVKLKNEVVQDMNKIST